MKKQIAALLFLLLLPTAVLSAPAPTSKLNPPKDVSKEFFVFETLPPNMQPKWGATKETKPRWFMAHFWKPGTTLKVAFNGGTPAMHALVANTAPEWSKYGNIKFDFGLDKQTGRYRMWSPQERDYTADIRIAFESDGHWSALGKMSVDKQYFPPSKKSMNLGIAYEKPERQKTVILHEFGHAIGFLHEHQHPDGACDSEFKWEDDPGYEVTWQLVRPNPTDITYLPDSKGRRPGLYTYMFGFPNKWTPEQLNFQMRQLPKSDAYKLGAKIGPVDRKSIMHYGFDPAFFKKGADSPCHVVEASTISELDKKGAAASYPF